MAAGLKGKDMGKLHRKEIPETMGAICAVVYILVVICFIPFPFYKDIVEATSGGGNRDSVKEIHIVETGRFLHRFPHSKVSCLCVEYAFSRISIHVKGRGQVTFDYSYANRTLCQALFDSMIHADQLFLILL